MLRLTAFSRRIRLVLFLFSVVSSVVLFPRRADTRRPRTERGTLIVAVRWRLGIVVCADRRRLMEGVGKVRYRDDALKIVPVPPFGLAATYGTTVYGGEGGRSFDVKESVRRYAGELAGGNVVRNAQTLAARLEAEMAEVLERDNLPLPQPEPGDPGVFAIILFDLERGTLSETLLLGVSSATDFKVQVIPRPSNQFITVLGHSSVALAIRGSDPRFRDLRTDPLFNRMLVNPAQEAVVPYLSKHDAMSFGRSLIRVTSERLPVLQETEDVSPTSDCAGLTPPDGFEWLPVAP